MAASPGDVAGFAAVRAIVQPIDREAHSFEAFADGAVFITFAVFLGFVALHAENLLAGGHRCLRKKLYLRERRAARGGSRSRCIKANGYPGESGSWLLFDSLTHQRLKRSWLGTAV